MYDVPLQPLPPSAIAPPSWNPMAPPPPAPPTGLMPGQQIPPAVAARKRKDEKKDVATKVGKQVLKGQAPPTVAPPPNSTSDAPPQMAQSGAPTPQFNAPTLQSAQYEAPKKGLTYLAAGLGLLFPGAPIANAAAGFAKGLQTGAQDKYKRAEQTSQDQFKSQQAQAQGNFQNQEAVAAADADKRKVDFENAKVKYQANSALRGQGIDPATGKPFVLPPALTRVLPPGLNRQPTSTDYASHENALAQFYTSVGASDLAKDHADSAKQYNQRAIDDANNARALATTIENQKHQDYRADLRERGENSREASRENAADNRQAMREDAEDRRAALREMGGTPKELAGIRDQAMIAGKEFYGQWAKALKPPTGQDGAPKLDTQGNPMPPTVNQQSAAVLGKAFSTIDRDSDPAGTAQHFADSITDPNQKELLLMRGRSADLTRRSKGMPILPHSYGESGAKKTAVSSDVPKGVPPNLAKGFKALPSEAQDSITQGLNAGQTIDQIRDTASQHGLADVVHALTDPNAPPPRPARFAHQTGGVSIPLPTVGGPAPVPHNYHAPTGQ